MSKIFRFKCSKCGNIEDRTGAFVCSKCSAQIQNPNEGVVQIYRMGSPVGVAVGYGIYINDVPYGHLGNKESVYIPLKYGTYKFHFTSGMTRRCEDVTVKLSPESPNGYIKASIKMGFWTNKIIAKLVSKDEMPQ